MNRIKSLYPSYFGLLLCLTLLLAACQSATPLSSLSIATDSPELLTTESGPSVLVDDQMSDGKTVVIRDVLSQGPAWIAIHRQNSDGSVGEAIGHAPIQEGDNRNVIVTIDSSQVTDVMYAMLHTDAGTIGVYEFPGPDEPVFVNGMMVVPQFKWSLGVANVEIPKVVVADQDVKSGVVVVSKVISNGAGWIVVQAQNSDGTPGKEIGYAPVHDGENQDVSISIDPQNVPDVLIAVLHVDAGEIGTYEGLGTDVPAKVGAQIIASTFSTSPAAIVKGSAAITATQPSASSPLMATPTPASDTGTADNSMPGMAMGDSVSGETSMIEVSDQPIVSDTVVISSVVSAGPGWIVVYSQVNNQPGEPIGDTSVRTGETKNVMIHLDPHKATPILYALLHVDQGKIGTFEFPGSDAPVMIGVRMIQDSFNVTTAAQVPASTPAGSDQLVKVSDQEIRGGTVRIDEIHSQGPGWIGIHVQEPDGSLGPPIGDAHVDDGITKDLIVKIKTSLATGVMYAMLHYDRGSEGVWEFPDPDAPVEGDMNRVMPPFNITGGLPTDNTVLKLGLSNGLPILVDGAGYTLYTSLNDSPGQSNCDDNCRLKWLPLIVNVKLSVENGVSAGKLGLITLADGSRQVTYSGYPLYYYFADIKPGDTLGQGLDGAWFTSQP